MSTWATWALHTVVTRALDLRLHDAARSAHGGTDESDRSVTHLTDVERISMNANDPTSTSLLRRAVAREPDAWERIVTIYSPLVRHWCRQAGIPDHDIQDVAQDVFAAVSASLATFRADRPGTTFRAWMRGIARHKLQHYFQDRGEPAA